MMTFAGLTITSSALETEPAMVAEMKCMSEIISLQNGKIRYVKFFTEI